MRPTLALRLLPFLLSLVACTSADVLRLDPIPRPKRDPETVALYFQERPARAYRVIAYVAVANKTIFGASAEKYAARLRKEAAKLGGDAVIVGDVQTQVVGANATSTPYGVNVDAKQQTTWQAAVVVWR